MKRHVPLAKRLFFWLLLLSFAALSVWWSFYLPYNELALYRSIPPGATLVSEHERLAERWRQIVRHPAVAETLTLIGAGAVDWEAVAADSRITRLVERFAARKTVIAYIPALEPGGSPAWLLSTWAGSHAQPLRWSLLVRYVPGLRRVRLPDGSRIWTLDGPFGENGTFRASFAVMDGVLMACLSDDPVAVRGMLYRMQRGGRGAGHQDAMAPRLRGDSGAADRGRLGGLGPGPGIGGDITYAVSRIDELIIDGSVELPFAATAGRMAAARPLAAAWPLAETCRSAEKSFIRMPDLFLVTRFGELGAALRSTALHVYVRQLEAAAVDPESGVFIGLYGGLDGGRILGLSVPTVIVAVRTERAGGFIQDITAVLDAINAESGWGLIPRATGDPAAPTVVIDSTRSHIFRSMLPDERPAVSAPGEWLVFGSNVRALTGLLAGGAGAGAETAGPERAGEPPWSVRLEAEPARAFLWSDLDPAGRSVQNALAVFSLGLLVNDVPDRQVRLARLSRLKSAVDVFQRLGVGSVWIDATDSVMHVHFRLEPK